MAQFNSLRAITSLIHSKTCFSYCKLTFMKSSKRQMSKNTGSLKYRNRTTVNYVVGCTLIVAGMAYGSVPLYRIYCQATGKGGKAEMVDTGDRISKMEAVKNRLITVNFNADVSSAMVWNFKPQMSQIKVHVGETALAFYKAFNPTTVPVIGISTYNIVPYEAGMYFNKIQCFCFEEQILNPEEQVDMPVFFYIDPEYAEDPRLEYIDEITLSYTFFESKKGSLFNLNKNMS